MFSSVVQFITLTMNITMFKNQKVSFLSSLFFVEENFLLAKCLCVIVKCKPLFVLPWKIFKCSNTFRESVLQNNENKIINLNLLFSLNDSLKNILHFMKPYSIFQFEVHAHSTGKVGLITFTPVVWHNATKLNWRCLLNNNNTFENYISKKRLYLDPELSCHSLSV